MSANAGAGVPREAPRTETYADYLRRKSEYLKKRREGVSKVELTVRREEDDLRVSFEKIEAISQRVLRITEEDSAYVQETARLASEVLSLTEARQRTAVLQTVLRELQKKAKELKDDLRSKKVYCEEKLRQQEKLSSAIAETRAALAKARKAAAEQYLNTRGLAERVDAAGKWGASKAKT